MLPITNSSLDLLKLWGNFLTSAPVTTIPTSYFLQGVQIFAFNNETNTDVTSESSDSLPLPSSNTKEDDHLPINEDYPFSFDVSSKRVHSNIAIDNSDVLSRFIKYDNARNDNERQSEEESRDSEGSFDADGLVESEVGVVKAEEFEQHYKGKKKCRIQRMRYSREEYKCRSCPYTCTTEHAYIRHMRSCMGNTYAAIEQLQLQHPTESVRMRSSVQVSCCICGRDRSGDKSLAMHMQRHRSGKHFRCDLCVFQTLQLKKLIQHRRMHTGEKPHLCPYCSYRSARRDNLRSHVRRVHKKENLVGDTFTPICLLPMSTEINK